MRRPVGLLLAALLAALLAVPARAGAPRTVLVRSDSFAPRSLTIGRGTRVTFRWRGGLSHNVTAVRGPRRFHSRTGAHLVYRHAFRTRGKYTLECTVHGFRMTVRVR